MSDRTTVYLSLGGKLKRADIPAVLEALELYELRATEWKDGRDTAPSETNLDEEFYANDVNYGNIDETLAELSLIGLDWEQRWEAGGGFGEGVKRCIAGEEHECCTAEGEPVVPLRELIKADTLVTGWADLLKQARFWTQELKLEIID